MSEEKIQVMAYSGYRGEETPRTIILHNKKIHVIEILQRWIEEGMEDRTSRRVFIFKGSDKTIHKIYYDEKEMGWFHKDENK